MNNFSAGQESNQTGRVLTGVLLGLILLVVSGGLYAAAVFMVSIVVFACVQIPPDWVYMIIFVGFPIPMVITSILIPFLFLKHKSYPLLAMIFFSGIILSCVIFFVWFLILTQYC